MENSLTSPSSYEFTGDEIVALYTFLKKEPLNHHIPGLIETVDKLCKMAEHELATRDSKAT
jgi:hypothetical protein